MPIVPVHFSNGDTWMVSQCDIILPLADLSSKLSAQDIGDRVLALASRIRAITHRLQGPHSYESLEACEAGIARYEAPRHVPRQRPGFVYVVQWENVYKIGRAKSPTARLTPMGAKFPYPLTVRLLIQTHDMEQIEDDLHERFADYRLGGEWFALTSENLAALAAEYPTVDHSQLSIG